MSGFFSVPARFSGRVVVRALRGGAFWAHRAPRLGERPNRSAIFIPCPSLARGQVIAARLALANLPAQVKPGHLCALWAKSSPLSISAPPFAVKVILGPGVTVAQARASLASPPVPATPARAAIAAARAALSSASAA